MRRLLGGDLGTRRIGLALAEPGALRARPLSTLGRGRSLAADVAALVTVVEANAIVELVVGLPLDMAGGEGRAAFAARAWAVAVAAATGLPVTPMRTSSAATELSALPWAVKIAPLALRRSPRSMPAVRGRAPTSSATLTPSSTVLASSPISTLLSRGKAQSSSSMTTPSRALRAGVISSSRSSTGWSGPSSAPLAMRNSRL